MGSSSSAPHDTRQATEVIPPVALVSRPNIAVLLGLGRARWPTPRPGANLYEPDFEAALVERPCPAATCSCHIGAVHLNSLDLYPIFAGGILERIPGTPICQ